MKEKPKAGRRLSASRKKRNRRHCAIRAKVEHVLRVLKCQFGYRKTRYRGIEKNGAQVFALLALANLYLARRKARGSELKSDDRPVAREKASSKIAALHHATFARKHSDVCTRLNARRSEVPQNPASCFDYQLKKI